MVRCLVWYLGLMLLAGVGNVFAIEPGSYQVVRVGAGDQLNFRRYPSTRSRVIGKLPANTKGIMATGKHREIGRSTWMEVMWRGQKGWVNAHYLKRSASQPTNPGNRISAETENRTMANNTNNAASKAQLLCQGKASSWSVRINESTLSVEIANDIKYRIPIDFRQRSRNNEAIAVISGLHGRAATSVFLQNHACQNQWSDQKYPYAMTAVLQSRKVVSGCCQVVQGD